MSSLIDKTRTNIGQGFFSGKKRKVIMKALTRPLRFAGTLHDQLPLDGRWATPET